MLKKTFQFLAFAAAISMPGIALANQPVKLSSDVFVAREIKKSDGRTGRVLEKPTKVVPGDELVFVVSYRHVGQSPADNFAVTNPMPKAVAFRDVADKDALLSVDGGSTWGNLSALRVALDDGSSRPARPEDVTHIRWKFDSALAVGTAGKLTFSGTVR